MEKLRIDRGIVVEAVRFGIVGLIAFVIHYAIYWVLLHWINVNVAYSIGYALSFVCNFFMTSYFTFKSEATVKRGVGFGVAHLTNYLLSIGFLNILLWLGIRAEVAPIPVFLIAGAINFLLVRFVFKKI
ncbi:MAG: GtrA family protein [Bacteroidaceae bacterium]|nr:GtrA family protein [Bacteroidaceae bacterium]